MKHSQNRTLSAPATNRFTQNVLCILALIMLPLSQGFAKTLGALKDGDRIIFAGQEFTMLNAKSGKIVRSSSLIDIYFDENGSLRFSPRSPANIGFFLNELYLKHSFTEAEQQAIVGSKWETQGRRKVDAKIGIVTTRESFSRFITADGCWTLGTADRDRSIWVEKQTGVRIRPPYRTGCVKPAMVLKTDLPVEKTGLRYTVVIDQPSARNGGALALFDLPPGASIEFANQDWKLINPFSGKILKDSSVVNGPFDYFNADLFMPNATGNIGHFLNNAYFNSYFTDAEQKIISDTSWSLNQADDVVAKVGLLTRSEIFMAVGTQAVSKDSGPTFWSLTRRLDRDRNVFIHKPRTHFGVERKKQSPWHGIRPALSLPPATEVVKNGEKYSVLIGGKTTRALRENKTTTIVDLTVGNKVTLGKYTFTVINPFTGKIFSDVSVIRDSFDPNDENIFNPQDFNNIGYYLNTYYYEKAFTAAEKQFISTTQWDVRDTKEYKGNRDDRRKLVPAKVGLLTKLEHQASLGSGAFPQNLRSFWSLSSTRWAHGMPGWPMVQNLTTASAYNPSHPRQIHDVRPVISLTLDAPLKKTGEGTYEVIVNQPPKTVMTIADLDVADHIVFGGRDFILMNPYMGQVVQRTYDSRGQIDNVGQRGNIFNPERPSNIAHYLNNEYYDTFSEEEKNAIVVSELDVYKGNSVLAKIGLLSIEEIQTGAAYLYKPEDISGWSWTLSYFTQNGYSGRNLNGGRFDGAFGASVHNIRPVIRLDVATPVTCTEPANGGGRYCTLGDSQQCVLSTPNGFLTPVRSQASPTGYYSASSATNNGLMMSAKSKLFQPVYEQEFWSGDVLAFPMTETGHNKNTAWQASVQVPEAWDRNLNFINSNQKKVKFKWDDFAKEDRAVIRTAKENAGLEFNNWQIASWIRGNRSTEKQNGGALRDRHPDNVIGNIVNGTVAYDKNMDMAYFGTNSGLIHGVNAETGDEQFGYIPSVLLPKMAALATSESPNLFFDYLADGHLNIYQSPDSQRTTLIGLLGRGEKGAFALNVSNPDKFTPEDILWERFTGDDDLGYMLGKPTVAKMNNGQTVVVLANGYQSTSGNAVLYFIDLLTGDLIKKVAVTDTNSNGLSTPTLYDADGDGNADYIYAGDIKGNVWKFDVTGDDPGQWGLAINKPLFTATDASGTRQPITAPVAVKVNDDERSEYFGKTFVFFGTGKYFSLTDKGNKETQTLYGLMDNDAPIASRSRLKARKFVAKDKLSGFDVRIIERAEEDDMADLEGWYLDFDQVPGERITTRATVYNLAEPALIVSSFFPSDDTCDTAGDGFVNAVSPYTGAQNAYTAFDLDNDATTNDRTDDDQIIGSIKLNIGIPSLPVVTGRMLSVSGGSAEIESLKLSQKPGVSGRVMWREIRN